MLDLKKISEQLIKLRQEKNLSQEMLAEKLFVSHQAISRWETGKSLPSIDTMIKLVEIYQVTIDTLLCLNIPLEGDIENVLRQHSRMYVIEQILLGQVMEYTFEDIIHLLNQDERYYAITKLLSDKSKISMKSLWPRLSFEERRLIINYYLKNHYPEELSDMWDMLAYHEKNILLKEGKKR